MERNEIASHYFVSKDYIKPAFMKLSIGRSVFCIALLLLCAQLYATKYGLIAAISNFEPKHEIKPLHSANDVPFVLAAWEGQGFGKNDITVLIDSMATKANVWRAMQSMIEKCKPGDIIWLHLSTHGQKLQDFAGYASDGYANSLVMYDSPVKYEPGYHSQRHLTDEDIRVFAKKIRSKLGPKGELVIAVDACHSGLLMRGIESVKGLPDALTEPGYNPSAKTEKMATEGFYSSIVESKEQEASMAPYVFFSACRSDEICSETLEKTSRKIVGPLSLAISHALVKAQPGETYRQLFANILAEMNATVPGQTPVASGNGLDKIMLGGNIQPRLFTYSVKSIAGTDTVEMSAGSFAGIYPNTEFSFYKTDDLKHQHAYSKGVVIAVTPFTSTVVLQKEGQAITKQNMRILEAVITKRSFGNRTIGVAVDTTTIEKDKQWLEEAIKKCPVAVFKNINERPELLIRMNGERKADLLYADGSLFKELGINMSSQSDSLAILIQKFARMQAIKNLQMDNPFIMAEINAQAIPDKEISDTFRMDYPEVSGGVITTRAGKDLLNIKITNSGSKVFYVNIIDIEPTGEITPFWPSREMDVAEYKIVPGKAFDRSFPVFPPYGMEGLKIILSDDDINLGVIAAAQGTRGSIRGGNNPIEMLFRDEYNNLETRSINKAYDNLDAASTFDINFKIVP